MKKLTTSVLALIALGGVASANTLTLYTDTATGQVYTTPGKDRVEMGDFIDAKTVYMDNQAQDSAVSKAQSKADKLTKLKSKAKTVQFSGTSYFGYTYEHSRDADLYHVDPADPSIDPGFFGTNQAGFELRRLYFQTKAYFTDKDFFRITFDTTKTLGSDTSYADVYVKYAYLYLDKVLPNTGVEIGIAHRPWIDYEEHNSWMWRSIAKVATEQKVDSNEASGRMGAGIDLWNSAGMGFNFKTKLPYFQSELALMNGEGYHQANENQNNDGMSFQWRLTGTLMGNGDKKMKVKKDTYANVSFLGDYNLKRKQTVGESTTANYDRTAMGAHAVYNQPEFLIAAQYVTYTDKYLADSTKKTTQGVFSVNGDYRFMEDFDIMARYDNFTKKTTEDAKAEKKGSGSVIIAGLAWEQNHNLTWIANTTIQKIKNDDGTMWGDNQQAITNENIYMLTAFVEF
jgi:hypothetical protein